MRILPRTRRRAALEHLADRVLEAKELTGVVRCLTEDLPRALAARDAILLLWDRRLESFEAVNLTPGGRLRRTAPQAGPQAGGEAAGPRWLLSEGHLIETPGDGEGVLVPLPGRCGLTGNLVLGPVARRRRPFSDSEARLVSLVATRAALALENHLYQRELIASERLAALGTVASMLAHDFRGPITVIRGYAETLLEGGVAEQEVALRAGLIVEAADRLARMTTETLDFARGAERLALRRVGLGLLLADVVTAIEQELPGLEVIRDICVPAERTVSVDVDKLRRAVLNIAANARDAMGGRGRVTLSARIAARPEGASLTADHLVLELADEGPGVPPEIRDRVFEPFVTMGKKRGTGLGLAVARRFVFDHGGSLELLPNTEGGRRGACFRLAFPLAPPEALRGAG